MALKYEIERTSRFKKEFKLAVKQGKDINLLKKVIDILASGEPLPIQYQDHPLKSNYDGYRECHITPDWLLIYKIKDDILVLVLSRTGSHSELFK